MTNNRTLLQFGSFNTRWQPHRFKMILVKMRKQLVPCFYMILWQYSSVTRQKWLDPGQLNNMEQICSFPTSLEFF